MSNKIHSPRWALIAKGLMRAQGLRQIDIADCLGVETRGAVGHYLSGRREPSIDQMLSLARRLGVTVSELLGEVPLVLDPQDAQEINALLAAIGDERKPLMMRLLRAVAESSGETLQLPQIPGPTTKHQP